MIDLVLVQANGLYQADMDLVGRHNASEHIWSGLAQLLCHSEYSWNAVSRMGIVSGQEGIVIVQFSNGRAVGPCSPLSMYICFPAQTKNESTLVCSAMS